MPYFTITDFAAGLDLRRSPLTAPAGTLRTLTNAHVTPGGEIEKRYAFSKFDSVPADTKGLVSVNQKLYTFAPMTQAAINGLHPTSRLNSHAYAVSETITVASNPSRVFTCTTAGTSAATEPADYATAVDGDLTTDGGAVFKASTPSGWTAAITPPVYSVRADSHTYGADTIKVASNPSRVFICETPGTSAATEPAEYATAVDDIPVTDGTAVFRAKTPAYPERTSSHNYRTDNITVASNSTRVFTCITPGVSAATEPAGYATAINGALVTDGAAVFRASTSNSHAPRADSHVYVVGDVVTTISNKGRIFTCTTAGTSNFTEPTEYIAAVEGTVITDGTCALRCSLPVSPYPARVSAHAYVIDDAVATTSNKTRIFTCTTAGTTADPEPPAYLSAVDGTVITDGTAVFVASTPSYPARANTHDYVADTIRVTSNPTRIFTCTTIGKSAATEPAGYASAVDNAQVVDGTAIFLASSPLYANRANNRAYNADTITVASNPSRVFTCTSTLGVSAIAEPPEYAGAVDGDLISDGTVVFRASTPLSNWIVDAQPPISPTIIEPASTWDVGIMPLEMTTLFEIVDYDLFDNKVFVVAWADAAKGTVVRCYNGRSVPDANGFFVKTYKTKIYSVGGSVLYFSSVGNPADWTGVGSGAIDLSLEDSDMTSCIALEAYYDKLAILSKTATQLWLIDPDPLKSQYVQTLKDAGTIAWRSVLQYGSGDVMYLSPSGVRSLRARNSSLAAAVSDIGSPLDPLLQDLFQTKGETFVSGTMALLQPVTGRFWIIMPDRIYVLSAFPGPKITAWSQYDPTTSVAGEQMSFVITAACTYQHHVVVRDVDNNVYAYGGTADTGPIWDDCPVELVFPFHAGDQPATFKTFYAIDAAAIGKWEVSAAFNPKDEDVEDFAGLIDGPTFPEGDFLNIGRATHMSLRVRNFETGPAVLSNLIVHYQLGAPRGIGT